jgi:cytidylate kinase
MSATFGLDRCFTFINCQLQPPEIPGVASHEGGRCAVTISRETGCGARAIAEKLAGYLQATTPKDEPPWTIFDRNLVERVLTDHKLPQRLTRYMPEDRVSELHDIMDELFGLHPSSWTLVEKTAQTILQLAELGNVIILGRGSNIITARLPHVLHVRLVGSVEKRAERLQQIENLSKESALERIHIEDRGRQRYLLQHFEKNIANPLLYHIVINTDSISHDEAAMMIGELALKRKLASFQQSTFNVHFNVH